MAGFVGLFSGNLDVKRGYEMIESSKLTEITSENDSLKVSESLLQSDWREEANLKGVCIKVLFVLTFLTWVTFFAYNLTKANLS